MSGDPASSWPKSSSKHLERRSGFVDLQLWRQFVVAGILLALVSASLGLLWVSLERRIEVAGVSASGFAALVAGLGSVALVILRTLYRSIARPIQELSVQMQKLNDGDFSARVPVRSLSEIGSLQANFNRAAERIELMIGELRKLDQMKSEFISTVTHELRTPLTSIGGYVKLINAGDAGPVTPTQQEFLAIVESNVDRLTILINDILDMERMESGKFHVSKEPQDLAAVLRECYGSLLLIARQKGLDFRLKLPERMPWVLGERARLNQIFSNLISNAVKYTNRGYVEVDVEPRDFAVLVRIKDSGIGISPEEQNKIFQKFYRTDAGLASKEKGTGLGLVITRGLVEAHGGTISVESEPGHGSTFTVTFPSSAVYPVEELTKQPSKSDELLQAIRSIESAKQEQLREVTKLLWIIDADVSDTEGLRKILSHGNPFSPNQALVSRSFLSLSSVPQMDEGEPLPDAVIIDPATFSGEIQSLSELRRKLKSSVPVLVVSDSVGTSEAFADGASAWVTKPVNEREFWIALQDLFESHGLRVLVGDPNTDFRILIKRELEKRGFEVHDVDRGKQVIGRLEQDRYDLVLIDAGFPDVSGLELLKAIRKRPELESIPIYLMHEGPVDELAADEFVSIGEGAFVGKERGIDGIADLIARKLEKSSEELGD